MRTLGRERDCDERDAKDRQPGVLPHGPASSNPARELAAALHGSPDRDRGRRDHALRALEMRAVDPEWRHRETDEDQSGDLDAGDRAAATLAAAARKPDDVAEPAAGAAETGSAAERDGLDHPGNGASGAESHRFLPSPLSLDLRGLRPPDDTLLSPPWPSDGEGDPLGSDPSDLDARLPPRSPLPDPDVEARLDRDFLAQDGARPPLAHKQGPKLRDLPAAGAAPKAEPARGKELRHDPPDGMTAADAAKLQDQIQAGQKALADGPKSDKRPPAPSKPAARPAAAPKPPLPPPKPPEKKAPEKKAPEAQASGGGGDPAAAWQARQVAKAQQMEVGPVSDADRYVTTFRDAGSKAHKMSDEEKYRLLESAEKAVPPMQLPEDAPKIPTPDEIPKARKVVDAKTKRKLPEQTLPDLEPTPLGYQPEVGMKLEMGRDKKIHIMQEVPGPDGKTKTVEIKVVPEDAKASKDDKILQVKGPKKGALTPMEDLVKEGKKKGQALKAAGKGKGVKIKDDPIMGPPVVPAFAKVDVVTVLAKVLASPQVHATHIVEDARKGFAGGSMTEGEAAKFIGDEVGAVGAEILKVKEASHITDEALQKKADEEQAKLEADVKQQSDKVVDAYTSAKGATKEVRGELADFITAQEADKKRQADDAKALAKGAFTPEEVKARRDALKRDSEGRVVHWRGVYRDLGDRREKALKDAGGEQFKAYSAAAEIDRQKIDLNLGVKPPEPRNPDYEPYKGTEKWLRERQRELGGRIQVLIGDARSRAKAFMEEMAEAGDEAETLIEEWANKRLGIEKSWWQKFKEWVWGYSFDAEKKAKEWGIENTANNQAGLDTDMVWLAKHQLTHKKALTEEQIEKSSQFSAEQKAMLRALARGHDSAGALAAGLVARISQQHRQGLQKKFEGEVMTWTDATRVEKIGIGEGQAANFATNKAKAIYEASVGMPGTHEKGVFDALTGLTKIQGRAVELKYAELYPKRSLREDLKGEMYDTAEQVFGTRRDWDKSIALLEGNGAKATAIDIQEAMQGGFLNLGLGTDEQVILDAIKGKSPEEIAAIKRAFRTATGRDLMEVVDSELDDGWSTQHDSQRFHALMAGDIETARTIEADQAMRGSSWFGIKTDRKQLEGVYKDIDAEVNRDAERYGWDDERVKREIAARYAALDKRYEDRYGFDFPDKDRAVGPDGKPESALTTAMRESFTWGSGKAALNFTTSTGDLDLMLSYQQIGQRKDDPDIDSAFRTHLAQTNAARVQIEHRSLWAADDEVNKAIAAQYETAYKGRLRDEKLKLEEERTLAYERLDYKRALAQKTLKDPALAAELKRIDEVDKRALDHEWAEEGPKYLQRMRDVKVAASTAAQADAKVNMAELTKTFDDRYREWNKQYNFGEDKSFEDVVLGDTGPGGWLNVFVRPGLGDLVNDKRKQDLAAIRQAAAEGKTIDAEDKTVALLAGCGYLSPDDKLYFSIKGPGTDEETAKDVFSDADRTESDQILARLGQRLQGKDRNKAMTDAEAKASRDKAHAWVLDTNPLTGDFSGREWQDQYIAMMGVPHTPTERREIAEKRLEFETNSGPRRFGNALPHAAPFGALLLLTPAAPLGGLLLGGSMLGPSIASFDSGTLDLLNDQVKELRELEQKAKELEARGLKPGDKEYDDLNKYAAVLSSRVNTAVELHRAQVDAVTDIVSNIVTAVVTVVVIALSIALSPFTGGASAAAGATLTTLMWAAVIGSVAATLANMAVRYAMKGDAYGWEDIGYDAVIGLVEAVASAFTAGLGDKFLKAGFLLKMAQGGFLERIAAHGLANAAEGIIQALPGALAGNILLDATYKQGNPFANILLGTVTQVGIAGAMSGGMGGLIGGWKKPTHFITPGTGAYNELWDQYKLKNPGATPEKFRLELHQKILAGEHPSLGKKQLEEVAREQILAGLDKDAAKGFKKLKVEVLPADEFSRVTRSRELGEAVVMLRHGEPTVVVKAGADFQNLHREAPHLMQTLREDTARLMKKLDESVLAHWDVLPIERQVDLYKTKLQLEIDAHQQMLKSLESDKAVRRFGKEGRARELEYTNQTLENLEKRMKEVEGLDVEAIRGGKARPHYLEEPPRLFVKRAIPEGAVHPDFKKTRAITYDEIERAHAAGYTIEPDPLSKNTPVLKARDGAPTEELLLVSIGEGADRSFRLVPREGYPDPPAGHQWNVVSESGQKYQLRKIDKRNLKRAPEEVLRYHIETGETVVVGNKTWEERRLELGKNFDTPSTFTEFETHLTRVQKQYGLGDEDVAALRRWSTALQAVHETPELAAHRNFLDRVFAGFEKRAKLSGALGEGQYESFYKEFRLEFARMMADQPGPLRQQLLLGFQRADGKVFVGLLDRLPDSASKGHFFREVVREDLKKGQRAFQVAEDFPVRHPIREGQPKTRDFDDAYRIDKPIGPNGPPPGNRMFEYKAGKGAFKDVEQALDQAEMFATGPRQITHKGKAEQFDGAVMVFSKADEATEALALLKSKAGDRMPMFLDTVEQGRFHIGFYDKEGNLQFFSKDDIRNALKKEPIPGPPTGGGLPSGPVSGAAAFVPGSEFRGIESSQWRPNVATRTAVEELRNIDGVRPITKDRFRLEMPGGDPVTVRVISGSMGTTRIESPMADVARYEYHPHTKTAVIQVSDRAAVENIERAMHHEVAELRELLTGTAGATDLLARGSKIEPGARLSPHDAGRIAELEWLSRRLRTSSDAATRRAARRELHALVEELGLREGLINTGPRADLVKPRLSVEAQATLADVRRALKALPAEDAALLREVRRAARGERAALKAAAADRGPRRPTSNLRRRGDPPGPLPPDVLAARAEEAAAARAAASEATLGRLRAEQAGGRPAPIDSPWIGGGAALAGVGPEQLFIDARGRWQVDRSTVIAQTADQLAALRRIGFADALQAAAATDRVPVSAIRAWEDLRAAAGPVLDAHGKIELTHGGGFTVHVTMQTGETISLSATGIPVIGTGFPRESVPGAKRLTRKMDPTEIAAAKRTTAGAEREWESLRTAHPGRVLLGDEANLMTFNPHISNDWLITGLGGTALSAAEVILEANPDAVVRMVGGSWTPGLRTNPQYQRIRRDFGGRFQVTVDVRTGGFKAVRTATGGVAFEVAPGHTGEAVIAALSGRNRCPDAIAEAVEKVQGSGMSVKGQALRDSDGYYLGYRLTFPEGQQVDVTGAASRFPPDDVQFAPRDRWLMRRAALQDAPAESGNFAGGFGPSAEQAERYARWRRRGGTP